MTLELDKVAGVILAGGLSRRMNGREKTRLQLGDKPIIEHVANSLAKQVPKLAINANEDETRFRFLNYEVIADPLPDNPGPLVGILAGMRWAATLPKITHVLSAAGDTPFFPHDLLPSLAKRAAALSENEPSDAIVLASSNGRKHPVFGLWPVHLAPALHHFLADENGRKVMQFVERFPNAEVEFSNRMVAGIELDPFFNINTPEDLAHANRYLDGEPAT